MPAFWLDPAPDPEPAMASRRKAAQPEPRSVVAFKTENCQSTRDIAWKTRFNQSAADLTRRPTFWKKVRGSDVIQREVVSGPGRLPSVSVGLVILSISRLSVDMLRCIGRDTGQIAVLAKIKPSQLPLE